MRLASNTLVGLALALAVAGGPVAAQSTLQSADGRVALTDGPEGARVADRAGSTTPLALPEEVVPEDLAALRVGWMLVGRQLTGGDSELYLKRLDNGGLRNYPVPGDRRGRHRMSPVVLAGDGELAGLVWLEGDERESMAVRASRWLGITWSAPADVSPATGGAQLALDGAMLTDGSWLLVWSGWDGEDDEVFWSVLTAEGATDPRPLTDNSVPDLLPTVLATPEGAVVAWNTFDGDAYRVATARRVEGRWVEGWSASPQTYFPRLIRSDGLAHLVYLERRPARAEWVVTELDDEGRRLRRGVVEADDNRKPLLHRDGESVLLEHPVDGWRRRVVWSDSP